MSEPLQSTDGIGNALMGIVWPGSKPELGERARRRISVHLIPVLFFLYILAYLDRVNISVAQLGIELAPEEGGLGFKRDIIGFGAGLFFWGYWILEIPSTLSIVRWGARWVFCRILVLWGICATLVGFIGMPAMTAWLSWMPTMPETIPGLIGVAKFYNSLPTDAENQFYLLRFMLGFFEGGFFPSVIVYLSHWFRAEDRAKAIACFMAAIPISSAFGLPVSGLLLHVNWFGLAGWRWIFITEGFAPVIAGFAVWFLLPDRPATAKWLPADERIWLETELNREHLGKQSHGHFAWVHHFGMVLLLTTVYFCLNVTSYGLSMFMPAIIKSQSGLSSSNASYLATAPYVLALIAMLINGWHSDRTRERFWHVAVPLSLLSVGIFIAALCSGMTFVPVLAMIFIVGTCMYAHLPAFWPIPTVFLGASAAASAIGFINMIGNLGGYLGPKMVGDSTTQSDDFTAALLKLAPWPLAAAAIILIVGYVRRARTAQS